MTDITTAAKRFVRNHSAFLGSVLAVRTSEPHIVLTFDDGPQPGGTEPVLDALSIRGATATFFILVGRARRRRALLADIVSAGHEIALHGIDHRSLTDFRAAEVRSRTADGRAELEDLAGVPVRWMRPPYGRQTLSTWTAIRSTGLEPVLWGPTTFDSRSVSQKERVARAMRGAEAGAILLAHDGFADAGDGVDDGPAIDLDRGELTRLVLNAYAGRGLAGRSLGDALLTGTLHRGAWFGR
jgi:peptidoglycan/xylan/chitin deacetylase (PgdA/CDA1 family)